MVRVRFFQPVFSAEFIGGDSNGFCAGLVRDVTMPAPPTAGVFVAPDTQSLRGDYLFPGMATPGEFVNQVHRVYYDMHTCIYEAVLTSRTLAVADPLEVAKAMISRGWSLGELPLAPIPKTARKYVRVRMANEDVTRMATEDDIALLVHEGVRFHRLE